MLTKRISAPAEFKAEDGEGSLSAVFSTFDVVDSDGDVVTREAFTDGQPVPLVWSHDWSMPIGKGVVKVEPERAIFNGQLWLDTIDGEQAYRKIKNAGPLQEFSWGFRILDAEPGDKDGMPVRYITKAELFEVSPVLVGANRETYTLAIKDGKAMPDGMAEQMQAIRSLLSDVPDEIAREIRRRLSAMAEMMRGDMMAGTAIDAVKGRRRLSRGQLEAVITTLQALLGDDEAEELAEAASEAPAEAEGGKATSPLAVVDAYVGALAEADEIALLDERPKVAGLLAELSSARMTLDALLKRIDRIGADNPREIFRRLQALDARCAHLGTPPTGRRAV